MDTYGMFSLAGRKALVTGSTRGIGLAIARAFCAAGAEVLVNGRDPDRTGAAAEELGAATGARAHAIAFDVADPEAANAAMRLAAERHGEIDILVNNAGVQRRGSLFDLGDEAMHEVLDVHVGAAFRLSRGLALGMCARGRGRIINVCSVLSAFGRPGVGPYCAAKGGLANLTRAMAAEWGRSGVTANAIAPGYTRTEITAALAADPEFDAWLRSRVPMGRWGTPQDCAGAAVYLASDAAGFVNGHVLVIDGGLTATL